MTTCTAEALELGPYPGELILRVVTGDAWGASLVLEEYDPDTDTSTVIAWPSAPDLEFPDFTIPATLSTDDESAVVDALASWTMTEVQVATLTSYMPVRMAVDGETWAMGVVECLS